MNAIPAGMEGNHHQQINLLNQIQKQNQQLEQPEEPMEPPKSTKQAQSSSKGWKGQAPRYKPHPSQVDDHQLNDTSTSASSSHQSSPRSKTQRRGMFIEYQRKGTDMHTYGGRDYRQWSRYPEGVDEDRYYKNWDEDDSCVYTTSDDQFSDADTNDNAWLEQAEGLHRGTLSDKTDIDPSAPEDSEDNKVTSITSP